MARRAETRGGGWVGGGHIGTSPFNGIPWEMDGRRRGSCSRQGVERKEENNDVGIWKR